MTTDTVIRPITRQDFIGQDDASKILARIIGAAKATGEQPRHILIDGYAGTGKSTCARIVANELGLRLKADNIGASIDKPKVMIDLLMQVQDGDALFIDEIHGIPALRIVEYLYTAMEDRRLTVTLRDGATSMQLDWQMPRFTVIGATTRLSKVPMPLRRRFPNRVTLDYYGTDAIATILAVDAEKLGIDATPDAIQELAKRGRGTPGTAINLLLNAVDYARAVGAGLDAEIVDAAMRIQKVDQRGLTEMDSNYLKALHERFSGNPAGVLAIAAVLGLSDNVGTVTDVIEPWLLRLGFIDRTPRGRMLTENGLEHLGLGA